MSAIVSRGRRGSVVVPNWRTEDPELDAYSFRIACWLASHADRYREETVSRNMIAKVVKISRTTTSASISRLEDLGIIEISRPKDNTRIVITFDFDVWEGGRHTSTQEDATRPLGGRHTSTTKSHQEEDQEVAVSTSSNPELLPRSRATALVNDWWESLDIKPAQSYIAIVKIVEGCLKSNWPEPLIAEALRAVPTVSGASLDLWRNTRDSKPDAASGQVAALLDRSAEFFQGRDLMGWRHENIQALRATIVKMHAWGFDFGETMIRIAIAARRPADMVNPTKLAALKNVARFAGPPEGDDLSEAMERAYRNLSWKA